MWRPLASLAREPIFGLLTPDSAGPRRAATIDSLADFSQVRWYVLRPAPVSFPLLPPILSQYTYEGKPGCEPAAPRL